MSDSGEIDEIQANAETAYEAYRAINHLTIFTPTGIPAPQVYRFLGETKVAAAALAQALEQLGSGLTRSIAHYDVYDSKGDPAGNAAAARAAMVEAAGLATRIHELLSQAQNSINSQGYTIAEESSS